MNLSMENTEFQPDSRPGSLQNSFLGYTPPLPEGSWARLAERRKKRRPFWFWSIPVFGLLLATGVAGFFFWPNPSLEVSNQGKMLLESTKDAQASPSIAKVSTYNSHEKEVQNELKDQNFAPNQSFEKRELNSTQAFSADGKAEKPTMAFPKNPKNKIQSNPVLAMAESKERNPSDEKNLESGKRKNRMAPGPARKNGQSIHLKVTMASNSGNFREKMESGRDKNSTSISVNSAENQRQSKLESALAQAEIPPSALGFQPDENVGSNQIQAAPLVRPIDTLSIQKQGDSELDSVEQQIDKNAKAKIASALDSVKKSDEEKDQLGFEIQFLAASISQNIQVSPILFNQEERILKVVQANPMAVLSLSAKLRIPLAYGLALYPFGGFSMLRQSVQLLQSPGGLAKVRLEQTPDGIVGKPTVEEKLYWSRQWWALPSAGLELDYRFLPRLEARFGLQMAWLMAGNQNQINPSVSNPMLHFALHYRLNRRFYLRTEGSYFTMQRPVPELESRSQNLGLGLGLVWKWE